LREHKTDRQDAELMVRLFLGSLCRTAVAVHFLECSKITADIVRNAVPNDTFSSEHLKSGATSCSATIPH